MFAAILIAVAGFGGTEPVTWGISESVILLLGLLLVARPSEHLGRGLWKLAWFPSALGAWISVQWLASRAGRIGYDTHSIQTQGLALAAYVSAFFVALQIASERASRKRLALFLVGLGLIEALYGLVQYFGGWQYIWNVPRRFYIGSATATYVNHNHFAALLEMILPLALGLSLYHWQAVRRGSRRRTWRSVLANIGNPDVMKCLLFLLAAAILVLAIVFSFSRMGLISMIVSLAVMSAAILLGRRGSLAAALLFLFVLGSGASAAWVGLGPVVEHFEQLSRNEPLAGNEGRVALWRDASLLIREHPWTGVGLGCFEHAFTRVRSVQLTYVADHAHNDYLEAAAELGIPCAAILFGAFFWIAGRALQASRVARSNLTRSLALGSLGGVTALLVHSLADFNLHIPANALVFAVVLGLACAAFRDSAAPQPNEPPSG